MLKCFHSNADMLCGVCNHCILKRENFSWKRYIETAEKKTFRTCIYPSPFRTFVECLTAYVSLERARGMKRMTSHISAVDIGILHSNMEIISEMFCQTFTATASIKTPLASSLFLAIVPMPMTWGWLTDQPTAWLSMEYFVEWRFDYYGWNDIGGDKQNAFICEKPAPLESSTELPAIQTTDHQQGHEGMMKHNK